MRLTVFTAIVLVALNRPEPAMAGSADAPGEPIILPRCQGDAGAIPFEELRQHASGERLAVRARLFRSPTCTRTPDCAAPLALRPLGQSPPAVGWTLLEPTSGWTTAGPPGALMLTGSVDGRPLSCVGEPGQKVRCPLPAEGEVVEARGAYSVDAYTNRTLAVESLCLVEAAPAGDTARRVSLMGMDPDGEVALSRCPRGVDAIPLERLRPRLSGDRVTVAARLFVSATMRCLDDLKEHCTAWLVLVPSTKRQVTEEDDKAVLLTGSVNGRDLTCELLDGKRARFRCPLPAKGEPVKVRGTYLVGGYGDRRLAGTEICRDATAPATPPR